MQQKTEKKPYYIFLSSDPEDDVWRQRLIRYFQPLIRQGKLTIWHQGRISAGTTTSVARASALQEADLIILLLTPTYLASELFATEDEPLIPACRQCGGIPVVPILCKSCLWEMTELASLQPLPRTGSPLAQCAEQAVDDVLEQIAHDICLQLDPDWIVPVRHALAPEELRNRKSLLKRVHATWIKGMLEQSLHQAARLDLQLQDQPDALDDSWGYQIQEMAHNPYPLPLGSSILQVYDEANGELLILGEPGAGKTTLLLELTRDLLKRAERSVDQPMPVVFHLSSWTPQHSSLADWMISELRSNKYQKIPKSIACAWIEQHQLIPLLDGLDEVPGSLRASCMQAINAYQQEQGEYGASPLVVSCRSQEYEELASHLDLVRAVRILPLTDKQIETYLAQGHGRLDILRTMLHTDQELFKLAHQPLMLNIFTLTYRDSSTTNLPTYSSPQQLQHAIFANYVDRMLSRRRALPSWISREQMQSWLTTIALNLQRQQQTVFSIEDLQRDWLPKRLWGVYRLCTGLGFGIGAGALGWLFGVLFYGLGSVQYFELIVELIAGSLFGLFGGLDTTRIEVVEVLTWSWKSQRKNLISRLLIGLTIGLIIGLIAGSLVGLFGGELDGLFGGWLYKLFGGVSAGLLVGSGIALGVTLVAALSSGLSRKQLSERVTSNEGTWRSGKNGLFFGLIIILPAVLLFVQFLGQFGMSGLGLLLGPLLVLLGALFSGLFAFFQHFILRFWLWRTKMLPWNLIVFLDIATARLLLYKVGGSYLFVHRMLLEYFVSFTTSPSTEKNSCISSPDVDALTNENKRLPYVRKKNMS